LWLFFYEPWWDRTTGPQIKGYFLGANDPYKSLKTMLKAEVDEEAWATLNSDISRPFAKPGSSRLL
jgi:hypothetical protein